MRPTGPTNPRAAPLPRLLGTFQRAHPGVEVELQVQNRRMITERLRHVPYRVEGITGKAAPVQTLPDRRHFNHGLANTDGQFASGFHR